MKQTRLLCPAAGLLFLLGWPSAGWAFHTWHKGQLPNGLTLLVVGKPGAPVVSVTLLVKHGATGDPPGKSGVASLTASLLTAGTHSRSSDQVAERIAALGGEFEQDVTFDFTTLDWAVMKADLAPALELLADVVQHPVFPQEEFTHEPKARIAKPKAEREETPEDLAWRHFFGTGPYGLPASGEAASLERIVQEDVVRFHRQAYRPEETILAAAGDLTLEEMETLAKKYFGHWSASEKAEESLPALSVRREPAVLVIDRPQVQASVRLAFVGAPVADPDTPTLLLLSHLLAGSPESRLGQNLRERRGWTYNIWSEAKSFRQTGLFSLGMSVPYEVVSPAVEETLREIARVQTAPLSKGELERVKQALTDRFSFETENIRDLSRFVAEHEAYTPEQEPPDRVLAALHGITAEEVQRVARKYLDPQGAVVTVVGDAQALGKYALALVQGKLPQWQSAPQEKGGGKER